MPPSNIYSNNQTPVVQNPVNTQPPAQTPNVIPQSVAPSRKKFTKPLLIIGILFLVAVLVMLALKFFGNPAVKNSGEIVWWGLWENKSIVEPLISEYEAAHPGVKITYVEQSKEDYRERLTNSLDKKEGPDIFTFHNTWVPMFKSELDALPSSVMTAADYSKNFYPVIVSDMSYGNSIVGMPLGYDSLTLFINEDIFAKAGKNPPSNWDDLRDLAKELTIKDENGTITQSGVALGRTENVDHWQEILALLMIQNGVDLRSPVGQNAEDALKFFTYFYSVDGVWDTTLPTSTQAFAAGKLAMYFAPSWRVFDIQRQNPDLKYRTVPVPQLPKSSPDEADITYATYWAAGVWSQSPSKLTAWDFLKFLTSNESLQKLYQNASAIRTFGEAYPRTDMASLLTNHPVLGSIVNQAPGARSWYLASRTFDGETGINTQLSNYFKDAVNSVADGDKTETEALDTVGKGVIQVLSQYGISVR
ncbi:MAG: Extracellular solute-binding protein, family 1 [uncultured bacterium]|nr:MAG: Extracellular solute-binding protein, family 1 [uncultured bacterium]